MRKKDQSVTVDQLIEQLDATIARASAATAAINDARQELSAAWADARLTLQKLQIVRAHEEKKRTAAPPREGGG